MVDLTVKEAKSAALKATSHPDIQQELGIKYKGFYSSKEYSFLNRC
jgi:hypothetical protein